MRILIRQNGTTKGPPFMLIVECLHIELVDKINCLETIPG